MNTKYDELFCLLSRQYDLTPLQAEMDEIITACSPFYAAEIEELKFELDKTKVEVRQLLDALAKCGAYDRQDIVAKIDTILEKYDRK